ncbi:hypothetical protein ACWZJV_20935 [Nocardioides sp. WG-D5]
MNLLGGIPKRLPVLYGVYSMPRDYYDPRDRKEHPQLVIGLDPVRKVAITASRTTKAHARGPNGVPHPADRQMGMMAFGWWLIADPHRVPYSVFDDDEVEHLGRIDPDTERRLLKALGEPGTGAEEPDVTEGETE